MLQIIQNLRFRISNLLLIILAIFVIPNFAQPKPTKDEKKREKEFVKQAGEAKYVKGSIAEGIDEQFKLHVGGCSLVNVDRLDKIATIAYVPSELRTQARTLMESPGENLQVNGQNIFWYVYGEDEIAQQLKNPDMNRFLEIPTVIKSEVIANPSPIFRSWIMVRNCSGYLRGSFGANVKLPFGSSDIAVNADSENKSSIALVGGRFKSPISRLITQDDAYGLLLNLELWRIYLDKPALANNAWYMNNFEGLMIKREANGSNNFTSSFNAEGNVPVSLVTLDGKLNAGITTGTRFNILDFQTAIVSDKDAARKARFTQLPTAAEIANQFKKAQLNTEDVDKPLLKNRSHTHKQIIYGIPQGVCLGGWDLVNVRAGVFTSMSPIVATEIMATPENKVPGCAFAITGNPDDALFPAQDSQQPPVLFSATLRSRRPIPSTQLFLERPIEQSLATSSQPRLRIEGSKTIDFSLSRQEIGSGFKLDWRNIVINFDDTFEAVNRKNGASAFAEQVSLKCGNEDFNVTGVATAKEDGKYYLELTADRIFLFSDFEISESETVPCSYETGLLFQLARAGNPLIRRTVSLNLRFPRKKQLVKPEVVPTPIPPINN